jgi:hypothetical protein
MLWEHSEGAEILGRLGGGAGGFSAYYLTARLSPFRLGSDAIHSRIDAQTFKVRFPAFRAL